MGLIKTQTLETAEGTVKKLFEMANGMIGSVPKPMQMYSASPGVFEIFAKSMEYHMSHPTLSPKLQAHIRFIAAAKGDFPYCIEFNKKMLCGMFGASDEGIQKLMKDAREAELDEKEKAMLAFVEKVITSPEDIQQQDVDAVRSQGWEDPDIFDAANIGVSMVGSGMLFNAFKMGI